MSADRAPDSPSLSPENCPATFTKMGSAATFVCTLDIGHSGDHEAYGSADKPYCTWNNTRPALSEGEPKDFKGLLDALLDRADDAGFSPANEGFRADVRAARQAVEEYVAGLRRAMQSEIEARDRFKNSAEYWQAEVSEARQQRDGAAHHVRIVETELASLSAAPPHAPPLPDSPGLLKMLDEVERLAIHLDKIMEGSGADDVYRNIEDQLFAARSAIELSFATLTEEIKRLNRRLDEWQESEASVCPEDWGFVEYVKQLETSFNRTAKELLASQADRAALVLTPEEASAVLDALEHGKIGMDRMQWWFDAKAKLEASRRRPLSGETPK